MFVFFFLLATSQLRVLKCFFFKDINAGQILANQEGPWLVTDFGNAEIVVPAASWMTVDVSGRQIETGGVAMKLSTSSTSRSVHDDMADLCKTFGKRTTAGVKAKLKQFAMENDPDRIKARVNMLIGTLSASAANVNPTKSSTK